MNTKPLKALKNVMKYIAKFGVFDGVLIYVKLRLGKKGDLVEIKLPRSKVCMHLRKRTVDIGIWEEVFIYGGYDLNDSMEDPNFIIDAGAHIGLTSIYFSLQYPRAHIISIEPDEINFDLLLKNTSHNKNIKAINAAVWSTGGQATFNRGDSSVSGTCSVNSVEGVRVKTLCVDDLIKMCSNGSIDLLKLDVEGAEKEIFEDSEKWINNVKSFVIEFHERKSKGCKASFLEATKHLNLIEKKLGSNHAYVPSRLR